MGFGRSEIFERYRCRSLLLDHGRPDNVLRIIGSEGRIEVKDFWFAAGHKGGTGRIDVFRGDKVETIELPEDRWLYSFEVDAAGEAIRQGKQEFVAPGMGWADSLGNLRVMDQWRAAVGLEYSVEKQPLASRILPVARSWQAMRFRSGRYPASPNPLRWLRSVSSSSPISPPRP